MSINSGGQMRRRGGEVVAEKEIVAEEGKEVVADFKPADYSCEILLEKTTEDKARDKKFPSDACIIRYTVDGKQLICYGGSQSIADPGSWSPVGKKLLKDVAIETDRFYDYFDRDYFKNKNLGRGLYFDRDQYGKDYVSDNILGTEIEDNEQEIIDIINAYPIAEASKAALLELLSATENYLLAMGSQEDKINLLRRISYSDFLRKYANVPEEVVVLYRDMSRGLWGIGWDALSALDAYKSQMPGTRHLNIGLVDESYERDEPYIFHFPDGNAGFARSIVRKLIPSVIPGTTMEDLVQARVDYDGLDLDSSLVRIRLNSTAVK